EDGIRAKLVTGVQTCALPISEFALVLGLASLGRLVLRELGAFLCSRSGQRNREVLPLLRDRMPAGHAEIGGQLLLCDKPSDHLLRLADPSLVDGVEKELRSVAGDDDLASELFPRLVVEIERPQPLTQRVAVRFVVELYFDSEVLVRHGEDATNAHAPERARRALAPRTRPGSAARRSARSSPPSHLPVSGREMPRLPRSPRPRRPSPSRRRR